MLRSGATYNTKLNNTKMEFDDWKQKVNDIIYKETSINCCDLPDEDYWMSWDNGISPQEISRTILNDLKNMNYEFMEVFKEHVKIYQKK